MNIFDEIRESYIYNGEVSLKALEDDIVTLENQIDSYNATLRELVVRGKKTDRIAVKIRETQMKLNMLRAVLRRETDANVTNDEMLDVLGVSGQSAKETDRVKTAADGKKPVPQDFQKVEAEKTDEGEIVSPGIANDTIGYTEGKEIKPSGVRTVYISEEQIDELKQTVQHEKDDNEELISVNLEKYKTDINTYDLTKIEDINELKFAYSVLGDDDLIIIKKGSIDEPEDAKLVKTEKSIDGKPVFCTYIPEDNDGNPCVGNCDTCVWNSNLENEMEEREKGITPVSIEDYVDTEVVELKENDDTYDASLLNTFADDDKEEIEVISDMADELPEVYKDHINQIKRIYTTFFFNGLDGEEITEHLHAYYDNKKRIFGVTVERVTDYDFYVEALMERNQSFFKRLLKKPRTIFMNVHKIECDKEIVYHYEFVGCRVLEVSDSSYIARTGTGWDYDDLHECHIRFKYKKLKLSVE